MGNQRLIRKHVLDIYDAYKHGVSPLALANTYKVSYNTIKNIVLGKTWKELKLEPIYRKKHGQ